MLSTKYLSKPNRKGPSGSTGGIPTKSLPSSREVGSVNTLHGIQSKMAKTGGGKGKPAVGTFANQVARVAMGKAARGQITSSGGKFRTSSSGGIQRAGKSAGKGSINKASNAFKKQNVRVEAAGLTPSPRAHPSFMRGRGRV